MKGWCKKYFSLKHPKKRFSTTQNVRKVRVNGFLKNIWTTNIGLLKSTALNQLLKEQTRRRCMGTRYMAKNFAFSRPYPNHVCQRKLHAIKRTVNCNNKHFEVEEIDIT